ncbi:DEAD/DEAH box helicase [Candidatus Woesearchaeota archaeon]|nr:MAG: DEAD/DEAH box helicase [Candidatus Woesearchaeota archaeon]
MIKDFQPRLYQETILSTCVSKNTMVILPTGMGKTAIAMLLAAHRLKLYPKSKILISSPTKPLCDQHVETFKKHLDINPEKIVLFTGMVKPDEREKLWKQSSVIVATPQTISNDVINGMADLSEVSLLVLDEIQHCVGDYDYVFLAKQYHKKSKYPRILGLTASPGSDLEKIQEICRNAYIEDIEIRTPEDPDVKPYVQETKIDWVEVELPESFKKIKKYLEQCYKSKLEEIKKYGYVNTAKISKKTSLLQAQAELHAEISQGNKDFGILRSISLIAEATKVNHAIELLETQGITALHSYMHRLKQEATKTKVKAVQNLVKDLNFRSALILTDNLFEEGVEHPKLKKLEEIMEKEIGSSKEKKVIVFTQFRDSGKVIVNTLNKVTNVKAKLFVGQLKKGETGLTQKKQKEVLDEFREGIFNCLVSTSIGEEGLDIPKVDTVVFYEPIPSAIRHIQRRGRTGRHGKGKIIVLIAKDTRDVGYRWVAHHKEKRMFRTIDSLKSKLQETFHKSQPSLEKYIPEEEKVKVFADYREKGGGIVKELVELGASVKLESLKCADYVLSEDVAVELKTVEDFVNSLVDGRLLEQVKVLKNSYRRPVIIISGTQDIYAVRKVHPNAIRGLLATIAISYGIPMIFTKNNKDTAALLMIMAKREQEEKPKIFNPHGSKKPLTLKEQQEYIVSALPGIGLSLAKPLLKKFKTVKKIMNAKEEQLKKIDLIGEKKAKEIRKVLDSEYEN